MESSTREIAPAPDSTSSPDALEFVRFCYRRRRVGWPELYDEMCAVANRGLFRGWGSEELAAEGIGFSLFELGCLSALVTRVQAEEQQRRQVERAAQREAAHRQAVRNATEDSHREETADANALLYAGAGAGA